MEIVERLKREAATEKALLTEAALNGSLKRVKNDVSLVC